MEIRPVHENDDAGVWQCHVTVYQRGNTHTLTSRSRVKIPHEHRSHSADQYAVSSRLISDYRSIQQQKKREPWEVRRPYKLTSFMRNDQELVQINREETKRPNTVVFDRHAQPKAKPRHTHASIDYEMSMKEFDEESYHSPRSRVRSTYFNQAPSNIYLSVVMTKVLILLVNY